METNRIFQYINANLGKITKDNTIVSNNISDIQVDTANLVLPTDRTGIAYSLANDYSGNAIYSIIRDDINIDNQYVRIGTDAFYFGISGDKIDDLSGIFRDDVRMGREIANHILDSFVKRKQLVKEHKLFTALSNQSNYLSTNVVDLTTTAVKSWTEDNAAELMAAIAQLKVNFNKAVGGGLFNEKGEMNEGGIKCTLVIPVNIWASITANIKAFDKYLSTSGIAGDYRYLSAELFKQAFGVDVIIGSAIKLNNMGEKTLEYADNTTELVWKQNAMYFITHSNDVLDLAGVKSLVYKDYELFTAEMLDSYVYKAKTKREVIVSNPSAVGLIKLNGFA